MRQPRSCGQQDKPGKEDFQVERRSGESSDPDESRGSVAEWAGIDFVNGPYRPVLAPPSKPLASVANTLHSRGFAVEALADVSVLRFPAVTLHGIWFM